MIQIRSRGVQQLTTRVFIGLLFAACVGPAAATLVPPPPTLLTPVAGMTDNPLPTFRWSGAPQASWYRLWVSREGTLVHSEWFEGHTQTTTTDPLDEGTYTWYVQAWNPDGATWSAAGTFTVDYPAVVSPVPQSSYINPREEPSCYWSGDRFTTWYRMKVCTPAHVPVLDRWLMSHGDLGYGYGMVDWVSGFGDTNHSGHLASSLAKGDYLWKVQEWRRGAPMTLLSSNATFTVSGDPTSPPLPIVSVNTGSSLGFSGTSNAPRPSLSYSTPYTDWYRLYISRVGAGNVVDQWVRDSWWRTPVDLPPGDYNAWVLPYNTEGYGPWSSGTVFRVSHPAPGAPSLSSPAYGYGFGSGGQLLFDTPFTSWQWQKDPYAYWYHLLVYREGQVFMDQWIDALNLPMYTAHYGARLVSGPNKTLPAGSYRTWVQAYNTQGTAWSQESAHTVAALNPVIMVAPTGMVQTLARPILDWEPQNFLGGSPSRGSDIDQYQLWIGSPSGAYHSQVVPAGSGVVYPEDSDTNTFASVGTPRNWNYDDSLSYYNLPFPFPFCGTSYGYCYVDSNGALYFGGLNSPWPGGEGFNAHRMIAVLWDDLDLSTTGDVHIASSGSSVTIRWEGEYVDSSGLPHAGTPVNASVTLYSDGRIRLQYGAGNAGGGLIGVSCGEGEASTLSTMSGVPGMGNAADILFVPTPGRWMPHWNFPSRSYSWWIRPLRCNGTEKGPWSGPGTFVVGP